MSPVVSLIAGRRMGYGADPGRLVVQVGEAQLIRRV